MLLSSTPQKTVSPEVLEIIGQQAARSFLDKKVPLNDAVVNAIKGHPGLNDEHIRRIVEFANNVTFQEMFQTQENKNIHFPVADPGVILRDVRDGGSPGQEGTFASTKDYNNAPEQQVKTDGLQDAFNDLDNRQQHEGIFGQGEPIEKNAYAINIPMGGHANPIEDVFDLHLKLKAAHHELYRAAAHFEELEKNAARTLYQTAKREVLDPDGAGISGVLAILEKMASPMEAALLGKSITEKLLADGVPGSVIEKGLEKTAGVFVNPEHPLPQAVHLFLDSTVKSLETQEALRQVEDSIAETSAFLAGA